MLPAIVHNDHSSMNSILYIFLPCKKVYPIGVTYLADFIHRRKPEVRQRILDLSLFPESQRTQAIRDAALDFKPDLVCFSWRDIQITSADQSDRKPGPAWKTIGGTVKYIKGNIYTVEDFEGNHIQVYVSRETKQLRGSKKVGDHVRAEITRNGFANSMQ